MEKLEAIIYAPEEKDDFEIEVYSDTSGTFAIIERQGNGLSMKVYNHMEHDSWHINLHELSKILDKAKFELETDGHSKTSAE